MNHSKASDPRFWERWRRSGAVVNPFRFGMSVSFCISRIVRGEVPEEAVEKIIAGTCCRTPEAWEGVIKDYRESYWSEFPDEAERIIRKFLAQGRVVQPRTFVENSWVPQLGQARGVWASSWRDVEERFKPQRDYAYI
jgi:hypothetical protein